MRMSSGRCEIETADTDETTVEAEPLDGKAASRAAAESLVEELSDRGGGHELAVSLPKRRLVPGFGDANILVRIRAPHGVELDAATASADIVVRGRLGTTDVKTASGDVSIEAAEEPIEVKTASGDVELHRLAGAGGVNTMSGDVVVGEVTSGLRVNTMSGDVRVLRAAAGTIHMRSMSGDLEAGIARGATLFVDATSASGSVRSELPVSDSGPGGPADLEVRATSLSGDVALVRAPETVAV